MIPMPVDKMKTWTCRPKNANLSSLTTFCLLFLHGCNSDQQFGIGQSKDMVKRLKMALKSRKLSVNLSSHLFSLTSPI